MKRALIPAALAAAAIALPASAGRGARGDPRRGPEPGRRPRLLDAGPHGGRAAARRARGHSACRGAAPGHGGVAAAGPRDRPSPRHRVPGADTRPDLLHARGPERILLGNHRHLALAQPRADRRPLRRPARRRGGRARVVHERDLRPRLPKRRRSVRLLPGDHAARAGPLGARAADQPRHRRDEPGPRARAAPRSRTCWDRAAPASTGRSRATATRESRSSATPASRPPSTTPSARSSATRASSASSAAPARCVAGPCNQKQGSSGGGWVIGGGLVNSVVSHGPCPPATALTCTTDRRDVLRQRGVQALLRRGRRRLQGRQEEAQGLQAQAGQEARQLRRPGPDVPARSSCPSRPRSPARRRPAGDPYPRARGPRTR